MDYSSTSDLVVGISNWVNAFVSSFWWILPTIILFWLPLLLIFLFWKWIRSYIKHIFVWWKLPVWDHITNCDLQATNNWEFVHKYRDRRWQFIMSHSLPWDDENVYVSWVGRVKKEELPKYVDENLDFKVEKYLRDHY